MEEKSRKRTQRCRADNVKKKLLEVTSSSLFQETSAITRLSILVAFFSVCIIFEYLYLSHLLGLFRPEMSMTTIIVSILFFDKFIVEWTIIVFLCVVLISKKKLFRIIAYILSCLYFSISIIQIMAFDAGEKYLSRLAVDNVNHISIVLTSANVIALFVISCICFLIPFLCEKICVTSIQKVQLHRVLMVLFAIGVCFCVVGHIVPQAVEEQRNDYLRVKNMLHTSPIREFVRVLCLKEEKNSHAVSSFSEEDAKTLNMLGFNFNAKSDYPLMRSRKTFSRKMINNPKGRNVIVFFMEGFSARSISAYGSPYPDLTPHLSNFALNSTIFLNYFNHTAATYRGLHGNLCSMYPKYGGTGGWHTNYKDMPKSDYFGLSNILNSNDYETVFLDCHRKEYAFIDDMMERLEFNIVLSGEELSKKYLGGANSLRKESLSDNQFIDAFIGFLKERALNNLKTKPFFVGLYNYGTHAFLDIVTDGKKYKDGSNHSLNTIYNFDFAFGKFWQYYKSSSYSKDTIVIVTSDHAHYPGKSFVQAFQSPDYQELFIDRIPFMIHDPLGQLPETIDAHNATSINFAPTVMHYLGLSNDRNAFLGTSLFAQWTISRGVGVANYGQDYFFIDDEKIHTLYNSSKYQKELTLLVKFIQFTKKLEVENNLWKKNRSD